MAVADRNGAEPAPVAFDGRSSAWRLSASGEASIRGIGLVFKSVGIAIPAVAAALTASLHVMASFQPAVAALDAQAILAREALACQSPWQVIEGRDCHKLPAGTEVNIVSGDEFFACVVWPGAKRCMWIARDVLRKP